MLKVGDEVIIKTDLITDEEYEDLMFVEEMEKYKGEKAKIVEVQKFTEYKIDIDDGNFFWNEKMIYPAPGIKAKENRTTFSTGAVRDTDETKGRCDLMPLDCVGIVLHSESSGAIISDRVMTKLEKIKTMAKKGKISSNSIYEVAVEFLEQENYIALGRTDRKHFQYTLEHRATVMLDLSQHFKQGAEKYGVDNWKKGIPYSSYIDSGVRHYLKHLAGMTDERHDIAFLWNMICLAWTVENMPEMNDFKEDGKDDIR